MSDLVSGVPYIALNRTLNYDSIIGYQEPTAT